MGDVWLTTEEVAVWAGMSPDSVRQNFPRRYNIRPQDDKWLLTEILELVLDAKRPINRNVA